MSWIERDHVYIATSGAPVSERFRLPRDGLRSSVVRQDRRSNPFHGYLKDDRTAWLTLSLIRGMELIKEPIISTVFSLD